MVEQNLQLNIFIKFEFQFKRYVVYQKYEEKKLQPKEICQNDIVFHKVLKKLASYGYLGYKWAKKGT